MTFSYREMAYLRSQRLARLATVSGDGQPDNAAVGFSVSASGVITIRGMDILGSRKGRNVRHGSAKVALIVDDLETVEPWRPRGIRIYGTAQVRGADDTEDHGGFLVIQPETSWSWGIEPTSASGFRPHRTTHQPVGGDAAD